MSEIIDQQGSYTKEISREFFKNVYSYMFGALAISGILASYCGNEAFFIKYFMNQDGGISALFWVVAFAPVGLGLLIQTAYQRLSYGLLLGLFVLYSALMGVSLSVIFLVYALPIAGIVNVFMESDTMGFIISVLGVFVFTGLTAYHMQQLKQISQDSTMDTMSRQKLSLIGGLTLYILFVNLFLSLLRLVGGRD